MTTTRLRWGILGTGGIATTFTRDLIATGGIAAAVGSRTAERAREFADAEGVGRAHGSYEELVADDGVDAIYVATPHAFHAEHAILAIEAGLPVLVEKSFTMSLHQADAVFAAAERRGVAVLEAMWTRFLPHMAKVHEWLDAGLLGQVRLLVAEHAQSLPTDPAHRLNDPAVGGGALLDLGVYPVSFAVDVLGAPDAVSAEAVFLDTGADESVAMSFSAGGAVASLSCSSRAKGRNTALISGDAGRIEIDDTWYAPTTVRRYDASGALAESFDGRLPNTGLHLEAEELERLVAAGETSSPRMSHAGTRDVLAVLDRVRAEIGLDYDGV